MNADWDGFWVHPGSDADWDGFCVHPGSDAIDPFIDSAKVRLPN
jgi:hypothetical protein